MNEVEHFSDSEYADPDDFNDVLKGKLQSKEQELNQLNADYSELKKNLNEANKKNQELEDELKSV